MRELDLFLNRRIWATNRKIEVGRFFGHDEIQVTTLFLPGINLSADAMSTAVLEDMNTVKSHYFFADPIQRGDFKSGRQIMNVAHYLSDKLR